MVFVGLTKVNSVVFGSKIWPFGDLEDGLVHSLTLLQTHLFGNSSPHGLLPGEEVLFHGTSTVVTLTGSTQSGGTEVCQVLVDVADHGVVVFVGVVSETKCDVVEFAEGLVVGAATLREADIFGANKFVELDSVICGFALAIGGQDEDGELVFGKGVQVVEIVLLQVRHHSLEAEA